MNDLTFLEDFLAEPGIVEEVKSSEESILDMVQKQDENTPITINPGEKAEGIIDAAKGAANGSLDKAGNALGSAVPSLKDFPKPPSGGIGLLLFISLLIVFAISQAPGQEVTRLQLLWGAILGNYSYNGGDSGDVENTSAPAPSYIQGVY